MLQASSRVLATDKPVIVMTKQLMEGVEGIVSLAQGVVHWSPPQRAVDKAVALAATPAAHSYGPAQGMPELRNALRSKVAEENGLHNVRTHTCALHRHGGTLLLLAVHGLSVCGCSAYFALHCLTWGKPAG